MVKEEINVLGYHSFKEMWNKGNLKIIVEEILNQGNLDMIPEVIASGYIHHNAKGEDIRGIESFKQMVVTIRNAVPDLHYTIDSQIVESNMVAACLISNGTFTGRIGDIEPTGKKFTQKFAVFNRIEGGKFVETWSYSDSLSLYQQLGNADPIPKRQENFQKWDNILKIWII